VLGAELAHAQTVVLNVIVFVEIAYLLNCRSLTRSMFHLGVFTNKWIFIGIGGMIAAQLLITYLPAANRIFKTSPIGWPEWGRILTIAAITYCAVGLEKWLRRRCS
jgi:cation-transporting ATPase F